MNENIEANDKHHDDDDAARHTVVNRNQVANLTPVLHKNSQGSEIYALLLNFYTFHVDNEFNGKSSDIRAFVDSAGIKISENDFKVFRRWAAKEARATGWMKPGARPKQTKWVTNRKPA